jgi:hypothetical protein
MMLKGNIQENRAKEILPRIKPPTSRFPYINLDYFFAQRCQIKYMTTVKRYPVLIHTIISYYSMEGFSFASDLDLNMGNYHIKLDADVQILCTIVLPWYMGKYK